MIKLFYKIMYSFLKKKIHKDGLISILLNKWYEPKEQTKRDLVFMREKNGKYRYAIKYVKRLDKSNGKFVLD